MDFYVADITAWSCGGTLKGGVGLAMGKLDKQGMEFLDISSKNLQSTQH